MGAAVIAGAGATGEPPRDLAARYAAYLAPAAPDRALAGALEPRFSVYKRLYPAVKDLFAANGFAPRRSICYGTLIGPAI